MQDINKGGFYFPFFMLLTPYNQANIRIFPLMILSLLVFVFLSKHNSQSDKS